MELLEKGSIGDLANYRIETAKSDLKFKSFIKKVMVINHYLLG